jgi:hypothetical protein
MCPLVITLSRVQVRAVSAPDWCVTKLSNIRITGSLMCYILGVSGVIF